MKSKWIRDFSASLYHRGSLRHYDGLWRECRQDRRVLFRWVIHWCNLLGFAGDCPTSFMRRDDPSRRSLLACDLGDLQYVVVIALCLGEGSCIG